MTHYDLEQFSAANTYRSLTFSPDGRWIAYAADVSGHLNVWRQPVEPAPDGSPRMPIQLTALAEGSVMRAVWSPDGARIVAIADHQGDENYQLYEIPPDRGWLYPITSSPGARNEIGSVYYVAACEPFSPDGRLIAYSSNARTGSGFDIIAQELDSGESRTLFSGEGRNHAISWSPQGHAVLVFRHNQNVDHDLFLCDVETGAQRHLTPHQGDVKFVPGPWRSDGSGFYVLTDQGREFSGLAFLSLHGGALEWIATPDWDIDEVAISRDDRYLAWLVNEDGYSRLYVRDLASGATREYADLPRGMYQEICFSPAGGLLGLLITRPVRPAELYMLNIETGAFWRLTRSFLGGIPEAEMVEPELIRYPTADGLMIPAFLYKPSGLAPGERVPVVVSIHGGPEFQERAEYGYNGFYQYLLSRKIGLLVPNIRGSTGYGKSYQKLIYRDWGGAELRDLEHAALYLRGLDWVDAERLGVQGGSFGGFATLSCATRLPQYWAAAVDLCGPVNLITFAKTAPLFWHDRMKQWVGDPEEDAALLRERSPLQYVENIRAPLLVLQGAHDNRVVQAESDHLVERLRALGRTVEYIVFDDEGHGFSQPANWHRALRASADWFERHLRR